MQVFITVKNSDSAFKNYWPIGKRKSMALATVQTINVKIVPFIVSDY